MPRRLLSFASVSAATRTVRPTPLGIDFEILEGDAILGPAIERGSWADHESALMLAHLRPGMRVLDLGANIGWFSTLAVLRGCEVHAFEPVPDIARSGFCHACFSGDYPIPVAQREVGGDRQLRLIGV